MGFPAVFYCVILPQPLCSLLQLLQCITHYCIISLPLFPTDVAANSPDGVAIDDVTPPPPILVADAIKERLPVVSFAGSGDGEGEVTCAVCLGAVEEGEEVRELGHCSHAFHRSCIDRWLDLGHLTCPLCRSFLN